MAVKGFFRNRRLYFLALTTYMGSILFGYDTGVMGSVLTLKSFKKDFGLPTETTGFANARNAQVSSNVVSLLTAGCFFGAITAAFINDRFGRRFTLMGFSVVFLIGAVVQTTAHHHIGQIYAGRVIAGLGVGGMSSVTPIYVSENCPPKIRGRVTGLFQEFIVIGVTFAYWLNYGVALHIPAGTKQWRIPVGIQIIPGTFLLIGLCFLKESPRWLMKQGRYKDGTAALAYMRCTTSSDPDILHEIAEIRAAIEEELTESEGVKWRECLKPGNRKRFFIGFCIMFWQQFSGTNSIGYYAPQIFQTVGVSKTNASLFATGVYGTVKVCTTAIFLFVGIDRLGRRKSLLFGAAWMGTAMFIIGGVLHAHPPTNVNVVSHASLAMVVFIYLFVVGYSCSWGPIPWVYLSEIFPTRLRPYGVGMGAATQWLFNFCVTEFTPSAINHLGWKTFLMFGVFCMSMGTWAFFFIKETKGKSLEEMDVLFGVVDENTRREHVERMLNKGIVVDELEVEVKEGDKGLSVQLENVEVKQQDAK